ncbi:hypothetical protein Ddc_20884 [Ditylenchus destructor]|nr:hypothetical protein Ddc_20884 [Ditylenchus destructor]
MARKQKVQSPKKATPKRGTPIRKAVSRVERVSTDKESWNYHLPTLNTSWIGLLKRLMKREWTVIQEPGWRRTSDQFVEFILAKMAPFYLAHFAKPHTQGAVKEKLKKSAVWDEVKDEMVGTRLLLDQDRMLDQCLPIWVLNEMGVQFVRAEEEVCQLATAIEPNVYSSVELAPQEEALGEVEDVITEEALLDELLAHVVFETNSEVEARVDVEAETWMGDFAELMAAEYIDINDYNF